MVTLSPSEFELLTPEERKVHLAEEEKIVFGHDFQRDRNGNPIEQGIASPGRETSNHFAAIRKYEGEEAYLAAVDAVWKTDPENAKRLNLPKRRAS